MADVENKPLPPAPLQTNPVLEDENAGGKRAFGQPWARWFISLRDKVNVINESIANLANITGVGFLAKNGAAWVVRVLQGTTGEISVTEGNGAAGNPQIGLADVSPTLGGDLQGFTTDSKGRIISTIPVVPGTNIAINNTGTQIVISASGGGGGGGAGGIQASAGQVFGSPIPSGFQISGICAADYTLSGNWSIWCDPAGSIEVDIWVSDFANAPPSASDSIVNSNYPSIVADITNTGTYTGWSDTTIDQGQCVTVYIRSISGVTWFTILLEGIK